MSTIHPQARIKLRWRPEFGPLLSELNKILANNTVERKNVLLIARAVLVLVRDDDTIITVKDVVESVFENDAPARGWVNFDRRKWSGYVPRAVAALRLDDPRRVLKL